MKHLILPVVCLAVFTAAAQSTLPEFRYPMDIPVALSANFGELRAHHFHSGLDFKTQQVCGQKVYAVADGYIARINISATGYGNCLYVTHPNGYTSVYAHLDRFTPLADTVIKRVQYARESFAVDYFPEAGALPVKKGQLIAYSGNTGSSGGPHLHFEIRETATQKPLDPQRFYTIFDDRAPRFKRVRLQPVPGEGVARGQGLVQTFAAAPAAGGDYRLTPDTIEAWGRLGLEVKAYDYMPGQNNVYGVYHLLVEVDGEPVFEYRNDGFLFSETRMINAFIDYPAWYLKNDVYMRAYLLPGNRLPLFPQVRDEGYLIINEERPYQVRVTAHDRRGNESRLLFTLKGKRQTVPVVHAVSGGQRMFRDTPNRFATDEVVLDIPEEALYDDIWFRYDTRTDSLGYSNVHYLHQATVPLQRYAEVKVRLHGDSLSDKRKYYLARAGRKGGYEFVGNDYENGFVKGRTRDLGEFRALLDTVPPEARVTSRGAVTRFKVSDSGSGVASYRGEVDGKWALFEHDAKNASLKYVFDPSRVACGRTHKIRLTLTDQCGNRTVEETEVYW